MRVGLVAKHLHECSGLGTYSRELLLSLAAHPGLELTLFSATPPSADLIPAGVEVVSGNAAGRVASQRWAALEAPRLARAARLDLLHYLWPAGPIRQDATYVVTVHDALNYDLPGYRESRVAEAAVAWMVRRAAKVITVSETAARAMLRPYRLTPERIAVTPLGVGSQEPRPAEQRGEWWLFMGGIERRKNLAEALAAWRLHEPRLPLKIVGVMTPAPRHYEPDELEGIEDAGVTRCGIVSAEELDRLYRGAVALLYPSSGEGFGLPVIEAMARGIPVIAARASAIPEVAAGAALLVEPHGKDLARAMAEVAGNAGFRAELREQGLERARQLRWDRTAALTVGVYRAAVAGRG